MRFVPIWLLLSVSALAQETIIRHVADPATDTHVEVLSLFSKPPLSGFLPVRVKLANNQAKPASIRLDFTGTIGYTQRLRMVSSFQIDAGAGKTVTRDFMVPVASSPSAGRPDMIAVRVHLSGSLGEADNSLSSQDSGGPPAILLSSALFMVNSGQITAELAKLPLGAYGGSREVPSRFDPKQLPSDWLAFSGFDSIVMTGDDWSAASPGARHAIKSWVMLGGQLVVYTPTGEANGLDLPVEGSFGMCVVQKVGADLKLQADAMAGLVQDGNAIAKRAKSIRDDFSGSWPLQNRFGSKSAHHGVFIAVLIAFAVMVGPVNLFVFAGSGRRHRLFFTTPLISLGTSAILIGLIVFQDGFGGIGMRRVLMEVRSDEGESSAYLHQEQISRTGIMTSGKFTVDPACWMVPMPIARSRWSRYTTDYDAMGTFHVQPLAGQMVASGDWWQSRSEQAQALSAVMPTRGRIEQGTDPATFVSTFDFPLDHIYYCDAVGQWHHAEGVATGRPFTFEPVNAGVAEEKAREEIGEFSGRNRSMLERTFRRRNHFFAVTGNGPAVNTNPRIRWKETRTVITGPIVIGQH